MGVAIYIPVVICYKPEKKHQYAAVYACIIQCIIYMVKFTYSEFQERIMYTYTVHTCITFVCEGLCV